jgi:predicted metal-binding membrane protein
MSCFRAQGEHSEGGRRALKMEKRQGQGALGCCWVMQ